MSTQESPDIQEEPSFEKEEPSPAAEKTSISSLEEMLAALEAQTDLDAKLAVGIVFMEKVLSQQGTGHFRTFWELRKRCQNLFKENISTGTRLKLWPRYNELVEEGRRLKEILDEQSAFAVEQIEIAIAALEKELSEPNQEKTTLAVSLPPLPKEVARHAAHYEKIQRELMVLNASASHVNALRKELMKTEMRVGPKNKFFQRLSAVGDRIFPRRKELIKEVSQRFAEDVDLFIQTEFSAERLKDSLYAVREEIKNLQAMAKLLTLNTGSFNRTRVQLSECWEKLKVAEKELRRERAQKKAVFRENAQQLIGQIETFKEEFQKGDVALDIAKTRLDQLSTGVRALELVRDEMNLLRDQLREARQLILEQTKAKERLRQQQAEERETKRKAECEAWRTEIEGLTERQEHISSAELTSERDRLAKAMSKLQLSRTEKLEYEKLLKPFQDFIVERREQEMLSLSDDDQEKLRQLRKVWMERCQRRDEARKQLEIHRKAGGVSGRDFEQAMQHSALIEEEKERLEKINQGIEEIEERIFELEQGE